MVLKRCVPNYRSIHASSNDKVPVYKLPRNNEDKKKWIAAIPRANLVPPSDFPDIPASCLRSAQRTLPG